MKKCTAVLLPFLSCFISISHECLPHLFNGQLPIPASPSSPPACAGCPVASDVDQEIVNFAITQLMQWGEFQKENVKVENFQSQVSEDLIINICSPSKLHCL